MRRIISITVCLLLAVTAFTGCSKKASGAFDEAAVIQAAEGVVELMNAQDYAAITGMVREDLREALSEEVIASGAEQILSGAGAFDSFGKTAVVGDNDKTTGEDYAIAVVQAKHLEKTVTYTIAFNVDMQIVGFYIK